MSELEGAGFPGHVRRTLKTLDESVSRLTHEDLPAVGRKIESFIVKEYEAAPYRTLATAVALGFSLGTFEPAQIRKGIARIGKLVAIRALS